MSTRKTSNAGTKGLRILFAAGGTGGHLFPALAVADRCRELAPDTTVEFVGTRGKLEEEAVPRAGYPLNFIWISGLDRRSLLKQAALAAKVGVSIGQSILLLQRFRPHAVVCAGAYLSYPVGTAAAMRRIPLVLMESNALPGLVIRKLAPRATEVHLAFEEAAHYLPGATAVVSGNPVRSVFFEKKDRAEARRQFGLETDAPTLLAFGGSLGARSINEALDGCIDRLIDDGIQVIQQTGRSYSGGELKRPGFNRSRFIHDMATAFAAADLVVSRAGATTLAELAAAGKPSVLVPLPSADNHQQKNAEAFEGIGAAEMILDGDLPKLLYPTISRLMSDPARLLRMGTRAAERSTPNADRTIAERVLAIAHNTAAV